ncbi:MAG: O-antigen ligase family protein [Marinicella sp.]|nr:O-antigen ligase family protein [Xanthomonadales bacterium]
MKDTPSDRLNPKDNLLVIMSVAIIALLPFGRLAEIPLLLLALSGLFYLLSDFKNLLQETWFKSFSLGFGLFFLLSVLSSVDSYWPEKSWLVSLGLLRFYLLGIVLLRHPNAVVLVQRIMYWLSLLLMFWVFDALVQAAIGVNLLGMTSYPGRLTGIFAENVKLGPILALFLPLILIQSRQYAQWWRWLIVVLVLMVILLSGTRSAWLMAAFVLVMFWWHHVKGRRVLLLAKVMILAVAGMSALYLISDDFSQRINRSAQIFGGDWEAIDFALADRLPIWQTAINMYQAHPINGVGARAFRQAYDEFAEVGDVWVAGQGSGLHAHHWVLELLAETGTIGLSLFIALMIVVVKQVKNVFQENNVWPYAVALMAALLPVVSLYSLFSSFWSICLWWLLIMLFIGARDE